MPVATRTETLDDLYTTTWNNRKNDITDSIFTGIPLYNALKSKGSLKIDGTGGRYIEVPIQYAKNETVVSLGRGGTVSLSDTKFLTVAQYTWKFVAGSIVRYFTDDSQNKSIQAHLNWANKKIDNLRDSMSDAFETYLFGDGTGNGGLDPLGLDAIVTTTPTTGTLGNIARATNTYWRNTQKTASGAASAYLISDMRNLANTISEGQTRKYPDMIVTTQTVAELYDDEVLEQRQIVNQTKGDADFEWQAGGTAWKGIPIMWSSICPSGRMYMLNSEFLGLNTDPDINFMMTQWKYVPNQVEDRVAQIVWKGELITSRPRGLGVMTGIA